MNTSAFIHKKNLPNGLRVLVHEMPYAQSVSARLLIQAAPRWETNKLQGVAHYLEHMIYEGSKRYPSRRELEKAIKSVGGAQSAYTDKEHVMYQAKVPYQQADFALEFLYELVMNPDMNDAAFAREKGIITSELQKNIDDPGKHRWAIAREFLWPNHILGKDNLGTFHTIKSIKKQDLIRFHRQYYVPDNMILVIAGNITKQKAVKFAEKRFGLLKRYSKQKPDVSTPQFVQHTPRVFIEKRKLKEMNILFCFSTGEIGKKSSEYPTTQVLSSILGNVVFHKFVYDLGISYSALSYNWLMSDFGAITVRFSVDPKKTESAIKILVNEITHLNIDTTILTEAKESLKSSLTLNIADTDDYAHFIGEQELFRNEVLSPEQIRKQIDAVTIDRVLELKKQIFRNDNVALILLGPVEKKMAKEYDKLLQF